MPPTLVFLGFPGGSDGKESSCITGDLGLIPELRRSLGEEHGNPLQYCALEDSMDCIVYAHFIFMLGFPSGSDGKESTCNAGYLGSVPGLGRSPGKGSSYPLQYSGLENSMDYIVHGVA